MLLQNKNNADAVHHIADGEIIRISLKYRKGVRQIETDRRRNEK